MHPYPEPEISAASTEAVLNTHIVVLKQDIDEGNFENHVQSVTAHHNDRISISSIEDSTLCGLREKCCFGSFKAYYGAFHPDTLEHIKNSPEVDFVEQDQVMRVQDFVTQGTVPSWGLARISNKSKENLSEYHYPESAGKGVTAYVIDTGINVNHTEFGGRATWGANMVDSNNTDDNGHGTHVAGTIGGTTYGLAKNVSLIAVKVLGGAGGSGTTSGVIKGIEWATSDASTKGISAKAVANMSLGGGKSAALNNAVKAATSSGMTFVVAAGNEGKDASTSSPASAPTAITVAASDNKDLKAVWSNYGPDVDIYAPGVNITSAWIGSDIATQTISGTSMASPHIAGLAACLIADEGIMGSTKVTARIKSLSTRGAISNPGPKTTDCLAYNNSGK